MPWSRRRPGWPACVVASLRRQVAEGSGDPADRIGAAFREWRGERVERLVGDQATQAFSAGRGGGQRERQGALGGDDRHRVLGLRGQRAGRRGAGLRGVPHRARPSAGAFGLPLPHHSGDRLTRTSARRDCP